MRTEPIGFVRQSEDNPRILEGIAVPYGVVSRPTELLPGSGQIVREAWAPGAFARDVEAWAARTDGRMAPFRPRHGERPIGTVGFTETPEGVAFRTSPIFDNAAGNDYLAEVAAGLNGVSIEGMWDSKPRPMRDGTLLHRSGQLHGLAGSDSPAFDGAHVALRDMEDAMSEQDAPAVAEAAPVTIPDPIAAQRSAVLADPVVKEASTITITRPELVYRRDSEYTYFQDHWLARKGNSEAGERVDRHGAFLASLAQTMERDAYSRIFDPGSAERAGDVLSTEIPGAYPTDFVPGLLTPRIFKGRPMGSFYQRFPISDARVRTFPKVTTSTTVAVQSAEGAALSAVDLATTAVSATPLIYGAFTDVSRQALDGADPSVLAIIYQDLIEAYAQASETVIKTAVEAGSTASGVAITAATPYAGVLGNVINYYGTRFRAAEGAFIPSALYAVLLAQGDTTGRPFLPQLGYVNSDGNVQAGGISANVLGTGTRLSYASTVNVCVFGVPSDFVIYESSIATFTYDQVVGPQAVRVGLWAYLVVGTRLGSLKVTAA